MNDAEDVGGGLYFEVTDALADPGEGAKRVRLANCRFIENEADAGSGAANVGGVLEMANGLFLENTGVAFFNSDLSRTRQGVSRLYSSTFHLNVGKLSAVFSDQALDAFNCIFWTEEGDAFYADPADVLVTDVRYCIASNEDVLDGDGNTNDDPQLDSEGRPCPTNMVAINSGDESLLPLDWLDLDDDIPSQTQPLPLDIVNSGRVWPEGLLDRGAYERVDIIECVGDVDHNDVVDTDDLLALLGSWGPCSGCPADFAPCPLNGIVDTDDLLALFGNWGECGGSMMMFGGGGGGGVPQSIQDCIDAAIENGLEGVEFAEFIQQCIENL